MNPNVVPEESPPSVAPLRKRRDDGSLYCRRPEVEMSLAALVGLSTHALVQRTRIADPDDPNYISSECVLHLLRRPHLAEDALRQLFVTIRQRVLRAVPVLPRRVASTKKLAERSGDLEIQESVLQKFMVMLCSHRNGNYEDRLDFFECQFNLSVFSLRATARKRVGRDECRFETTDFADNAETPSTGIESQLLGIWDALNDERVDFLYRSKLGAAINALPSDQQRVIELGLQEVPIDSQHEGALTIVGLVGCCAKTVHNLRKRAFNTLRNALKEEDGV